MRQGRCTFPPDVSGRVCDRLAGLEQVIDSETVRQVLLETGRANPRACKLTHEVILWVVLAMGIFTNVPIRQVFKRTRFARARVDSPCRSSLCHARQRLGVAPVRRLFHETVRLLATPETPGAFYKGMRLMGIDAVVLNLPDRPANETTFGRPSGGERGDGVLPQIRKVSLVELGTHVETTFVPKLITTGEHSVISALLRHMSEDGLLLWDRSSDGCGARCVCAFDRLLGSQRYDVLGELNAVTLKLVRATNDDYVNSTTVCELLQNIADLKLPTPMTLVMDNARYQCCRLVQDLAKDLNIELLFLPSYSPSVNLIERLWKFVKKTTLNSRRHASFAEFQTAIDHCLDRLTTDHKPAIDTLLTRNFQTFGNVTILRS